MAKRKALSSKNAPRSLGVTFFAAAWLLADRIGLPGWGWGVWWTLAVIVAAVRAYDVFNAQDVELPP